MRTHRRKTRQGIALTAVIGDLRMVLGTVLGKKAWDGAAAVASLSDRGPAQLAKEYFVWRRTIEDCVDEVCWAQDPRLE